MTFAEAKLLKEGDLVTLGTRDSDPIYAVVAVSLETAKTATITARMVMYGCPAEQVERRATRSWKRAPDTQRAWWAERDARVRERAERQAAEVAEDERVRAALGVRPNRPVAAWGMPPDPNDWRVVLKRDQALALVERIEALSGRRE